MLIVVACVAVVAFVIRRRGHERERTDPGTQLSAHEATRLLGKPIGSTEDTVRVRHPVSDRPQLQRLHQELRVKVLHDDSLVTRLVAAERERAPNASEVEWYREAIDRWERENPEPRHTILSASI